jgi:hypothetical protein
VKVTTLRMFVGQPEDLLAFSPGFPGLDGSSISTGDSGWGVVPGDPQWDPFDPDFFAGDGRMLIGQFSTADGSAILWGMMLIAGISNGEVAQHVVSFFHVPGPGAMWLLGAAGVLRSRRRTGGDCPRSRSGPIRGDQCR